ncbi:hypothetical protein TURU_097333 [Turdus rufiventris]|nr:hypothetical protein TURU_097333 [Turdus rufiventris]
MKLNLRLLRCHHGRKDQRVARSKAVAEEEEVATTLPMEGGEVTTMAVTTAEEEEAMTHMEGEEVMNKEAMIEGDEEDVVVMIMVAEEEEEETSFKEAGQMVEVVATRMAATGRATTEMQVFKQVATMVVVVVATKEEAMVATSRLLILEVATKGVVVVVTSKTTDTKMVGPTVTEGVGVEEGGVAVVVAVAEEVKEAAGGAEVDRILIKEGSLSSTSSMEVISIISLALDKEDTSPAEAAQNLHFSRARIIETWF